MLSIRRLGAMRGRRTLFSDLNFELAPGHWLQITGQNGAGKTTLLRTLIGLTPPHTGEVLWMNESIRQSPSFHRDLLWCAHNDGLHGSLTPAENLELSCALADIKPNRQVIEQALQQMGLMPQVRAKLPAASLSRGQRQRVSLARLLLIPAKLWILDEPFASMDKEGMAQCKDLMMQHLNHQGLLVFTSHQEIDLTVSLGHTLHLEMR